MVFPNLDFIFLQLGTGCVSNCGGCNRKLEKYIIYNNDIIINNLNQIVKHKIYSGKILLYNIDYFDISNDFLFILNQYSESFEKLYFHTNFSNNNFNFDNKYNNNFIYQRDINNFDELDFLHNIFNGINIEGEILCILRYTNFDLLKDYIKNFCLFFKDYKIRKENHKIILELKINNGAIVNVIFINKLGTRFGIKKCRFKELVINKNNIYLSDYYFPEKSFEILLNGDLRVHEPPCGTGDLVISNIYRNELNIISDFNKFKKYIDNLLNNYIGDNLCLECNKNYFHY